MSGETLLVIWRIGMLLAKLVEIAKHVGFDRNLEPLGRESWKNPGEILEAPFRGSGASLKKYRTE